MSNETPSERSDWRDRLDGLEHLPGEAWTGGEAGWDKLYDRLHQKENTSRRKLYPVYWVAAASALLIIGIGIVHERQSSVEVPSSARLTTPSPATLTRPAPAVAETHPPVAGKTDIAINGQTHTPVGPKKQGLQVLETPAFAQAPSTTAPSRKTPAVAETHPVLVAAAPKPKKLPVVSINELGDDDQTPVGGGRNPGDRYFQINLINKQTYTETASESSHHNSNRVGLNIHR